MNLIKIFFRFIFVILSVKSIMKSLHSLSPSWSMGKWKQVAMIMLVLSLEENISAGIIGDY